MLRQNRLLASSLATISGSVLENNANTWVRKLTSNYLIGSDATWWRACLTMWRRLKSRWKPFTRDINRHCKVNIIVMEKVLKHCFEQSVYFSVQFKIMNENILHLGLCLPKSCTNGEIETLVQKYFDEKSELLQFYKLEATVLNVKKQKFNPRFLLQKSILILVVIIAAVTWLTQSAGRLKKMKDLDANNNVASENEKKMSLTDEIIECFSYSDNVKSILSRETSKNSLKSISGLRWMLIN